jgi:hypothetical protein
MSGLFYKIITGFSRSINIRLLMRLITWLIIIAFLSGSCNNQNNNSAALDELRQKIDYTNKFIAHQNELAADLMEQRLVDAETREKALIWAPRVASIRSITNWFTMNLQQLQKAPAIENDILKIIQKFRDSIGQIDPSIRQEFGSEFDQFPNLLMKKEISADQVRLSELRGSTKQIYLSQIIQQCRVLENRLIIFCVEHCASSTHHYDYFAAIIGQSSSVVSPLEKITVTAGVGSFTREAKPGFLINGQLVEPDETNIANYSFHAPSKAGTYHVPVEINYTDQDGKKQTIIKTITYRVKL